jgi:DNA repair photolyase
MNSIKLVKQRRKSPVLKLPIFGCLKGTPAINITRGCLHSCVYCYARGFTEAPPKGEIHLYKNLPELLERELENRMRRGRLPQWVSFSTASDAFQDIDEVLDITFKTMKSLLEKGIGISFLTKGYIYQEFIDLFSKYRGQIKARIGIVSLDEDYRRLFEPRTAHPLKRLLNIRNLIGTGIEVATRIDPIIPLVSDSLESLIKRLKVVGIKNITISHLVMRPSIMNQMFNDLPFSLAKEIIMPYRGQPWQRVITSARTRLLPKDLRLRGLKEIKYIASRYGIDCYYCGCKNPDLKWEPCNPWVDDTKLTVNGQLNLFMPSFIKNKKVI